MKRGVIDTLKRGLDNTLANWPVIIVRLAETFLFAIIAVLTALAILIPIIVSVGIRFADVETPEDVLDAMALLAARWIVLVWIFVALLVLFLIFVMIHSFVEAGCARVAIDADRLAGPAMSGARSRFRVFSMQRWMAGGKDGWWTVFWIYNIAWGIAGLFMLIPLAPTLVLMLIFRENPAAAITSGCIGLVVTVLFMIVLSIAASLWTKRAIAAWAARRHGAPDALAVARHVLRVDLARHLLIALSVFVVAMAGSSFFASFSFFAAIGESMRETAVLNVVTMPLRVAGWFFSSAFSAAVTTWFLASYGALAVED